MIHEKLEVLDGSPLTWKSPLLIVVSNAATLPSDLETQIVIGAAPWDPTAPVAINFLRPDAGENAYQNRLVRGKKLEVL